MYHTRSIRTRHHSLWLSATSLPPSASERRGDKLQGLKDLDLIAQAIISPWLCFMCHVCFEMTGQLRRGYARETTHPSPTSLLGRFPHVLSSPGLGLRVHVATLFDTTPLLTPPSLAASLSSPAERGGNNSQDLEELYLKAKAMISP